MEPLAGGAAISDNSCSTAKLFKRNPGEEVVVMGRKTLEGLQEDSLVKAA